MIPIEGKVYAPDDGEVYHCFHKHVLGIRLENGLELLIHVGINTVNLEGQGFKNLVVQGSKFKQGDVLLEFDINKIKKAGLSVETAIIVVSDESNWKLLSSTTQLSRSCYGLSKGVLI